MDYFSYKALLADGPADPSPEIRILGSLPPAKARPGRALRTVVIKNGLDEFEIEWLPSRDYLSTCLGIGIELFRCHVGGGLAAWYGWCFETGGTGELMINEIWGEWHSRCAVEGYMPQRILSAFSFRQV